MITTKADRLVRSLIDAGLSLTDFTILASKVIRIQRDFKIDNASRRERDRLRQQDKLRKQQQFEQQLKDEEQRKIKGLAKLHELGYVTGDDTYQIGNNKTIDSFDQYSINEIGHKDNKIKSNQLLLSYSKEINDMKEKQRDCCLPFNIDYDLRLNQQALERACRRAKRNIYELRAERFNRPEFRSVLSVETVTLHNKLKETIREINKIFLNTTFQQDKRHLQELLTYINQYEGDIDLLMCQMQYEPKVKETILFSPVTTDILDRMNLILYYVRTLAKRISTGDYLDEHNENIDEDIPNNSSSIPTKVSYIIKIKTNDEKSSSLSDATNVSIKLYGTHNKSSDIHLLQSNHKTKWQSGQIDIFNIQLNYLGDIYVMEIGHDSQYSLWKVDWIEIIDDAANRYRFPLNRLFDKYSDEKKTRFIIQRDIGPVNRLPSKPLKQFKSYKQLGFTTYTIQVKTAKQPNKITDSVIFLELKGENGSFSDNLCSANSAFKSSIFEPGQLDTFYLIWPHLAKIHSLHLFIQSEGIQPSWFCEYITIEDNQTGDRYKFIMNQLFDGSNSNDVNAKKTLTVYPENTNEKLHKEDKDKPSYFLKLKTGEKGLSDMSSLPPINVILKGEKGKSEPYILKSLDNKRKLFQDNQIDEFILSSKYYVGPIKTLQLSSNGQIDKWFIETIIIRDINQQQDYLFPIYKWIDSEDGTNTLTIHPINEQKPDYIVYIRTISSELKGPDRSVKLLVQGNNGKHEMELNYPITMHNTFQPGHKDEYYIDNMKSLGDLQSIEINLTHPNIKKLGIDYIEIKDMSTNESYRFNINRMLDLKNSKIIAKAESISRSIKNASSSKTSRSQILLPNTTNKTSFDQLTTNIPQGAKQPTNTDYKVSIKTGDSSLIGTDLNVQLQLLGDKGTSEKIHLKQSKTNSKTLFANNNQDTFSLHIPDIGTLTSATLSIVGKIQNEWSISTLEIIEEDSNRIYQADINQYLGDKNKEQCELTIHLNEHLKSTSEYDNLLGKNSEKDIYKIKIKTIDKQFLDKDTKLQIELIDEYEQSEKMIINQTESLQKNQIDTFTMETIKDLGKLNNIKLSFVGSKFLKKDFYQPEFIEILHLKTNKTYRITYTKDDFLNSDKNRLELIKSIKLLSDTNIREKIHPQNANPPTPTINKSTPSPYKKLADNILSETDAEDFSLLNNTTTSSLSKDMNSLSERLTNSSSRQIRPGDRVKSNSKKQVINQQSKSSAHEADWYRRSIETNKDHRNEIKQIQLNSQQRISQTKFDQQQAHLIKQRSNDEKHQNINRQLSKDKKISSQENSLKQQKTNELPNRSSVSKTQQQLNELEREMMNNKTSTNSNIIQNNQISKQISSSSSSSLTRGSTDEQRQIKQNKDSTPTKILVESPTPSNISQLTNSIKISRTSHDQSTISARSSKTSDHLVNQPKPISLPFKNNQSMAVLSKSVPPKPRTSNDTPTRRSLSIPFNRDEKISKDQSHQINHPSSSSPPLPSNSTRIQSPSNKIPNKSFSTSAKTYNNIIIDPSFTEDNSQPNAQAISAVTIHTTATKSDSDSNLTRKSIDSQGSEYSLQSKSLLSPDTAKKSRKHRRQNTSRTSEKQQAVISQSLTNTADAPTNNHRTSLTNKYLSKETSDIQYASSPSLNKSQTDHIQLVNNLKPANTISKQSPSNNTESHTKDKDITSKYISDSLLNTSTTTDDTSLSTTTQKHHIPYDASDIEHSTSLKNQSIPAKLEPSKLTGVDHMSTVYEESEPSATTTNNVLTSSFTEHDSNKDNIHDWLEISSSATSNEQNSKRKSSSKEQSPSPSAHHRRTIDAKTKLTSNQSNSFIEYEFRVQIGNESQLDGTNEPVFIELTNIKDNSIKIPLHNSINNSQAFQKGQLDIFHFNIPKNFHLIKKINIFLPKSNKDPLHIRYCELQDRQTMNTFHFPIEKWLGEKNIYNVEMFINNNNNLLS